MADMMETRKVGLLCVCKRLDGRGTKRNSWGGCKLLRSGANEQEWNGMGIVLSKGLKEDLISSSRKNDPVMTYRAYAAQVGCIENEKETFWEHYVSRTECHPGWRERDCRRIPKFTHKEE